TPNQNNSSTINPAPTAGDCGTTSTNRKNDMQTIEKTIEVERPISAVYDQWTRFQEFPKFMEGIKEVRLVDDRHFHWKAEIGGKVKGWDAEIVEQVSDQRIRW